MLNEHLNCVDVRRNVGLDGVNVPALRHLIATTGVEVPSGLDDDCTFNSSLSEQKRRRGRSSDRI